MNRPSAPCYAAVTDKFWIMRWCTISGGRCFDCQCVRLCGVQRLFLHAPLTLRQASMTSPLPTVMK